MVSVPEITVTASGYGGDGAFADFDIDGGVGGAGTGGEASATITSGTIRTDSLLVEANGNTPISDPIFGGISYFGNGGFEFGGTLQPGRGGLGTGGVALVTIDGGSLSTTVPSRDVPLQVQVRATGSGGLGGYSYGSGTPQYSGSGGDGVGGTATLRYLSGVFDAGIIGVDATGSGGRAGNFINDAEDAFFGGSGGSGTGGTATFEIAADFSASTSLGDLRTVTVSADGIGAISEIGTNGGTGGNGTGGTGRLLVAASTTALGDLTITAEGRGSDGGDGKSGGNGGRGGAGIGGVVEVVSDGLGARLTVTGAALSAAGVGGNGGYGGADAATAGNGGAGGLAIGGEVAFAAANLGTLTVSGPSIEASGRAGNGGLGGNSALVGGVAQGNGGNGADGSGGAITATASGGGSLAFDGLTLIASGLGGAGGGRVDGSSSGTPGPSIGGTGGRGRGGLIALNSTGADSSISFGSLTATVDGTGGAGADGAGSTASGDGTAGSAGGDGFGGAFSLLADLGGSITIAEADGGLAISTSGFGGNGGRGVDATGSSGGSGGNGGAAGAGSGAPSRFWPTGLVRLRWDCSAARPSPQAASAAEAVQAATVPRRAKLESRVAMAAIPASPSPGSVELFPSERKAESSGSATLLLRRLAPRSSETWLDWGQWARRCGYSWHLNYRCVRRRNDSVLGERRYRRWPRASNGWRRNRRRHEQAIVRRSRLRLQHDTRQHIAVKLGDCGWRRSAFWQLQG
ncbi:hypothetical protein C7W88_14915 [Novosphingobium sp. THN1]|uniref:hypothetical protein n=1 Tax=Novosphingobium sp. THN1 TaxID=1016987 RepID=UPI000E4C1847|nr:hypothetical protein [Novosphingobium sp. THN1]AXU20041.1 hypothetical protein C7W88_14915 [Novosphingobium sp. THN1]